MKSWLALLLAFAALSWGQSAWAGSRVVLLQFSGRKADVLREKVAESLEEAGHSVVLSRSPSESTSASRARSLAKRANAELVVAGSIRRHSMQLWSAELSVRDGQTGEPLGRKIKFKSSWLPGLAKALLTTAGERVSSVADGSDEGADEVWNADTGGFESESEAGAVEAAPEPKPVENLFEVDATVIPGADEGAAEESVAPAEGALVHLKAGGGLVRRSFDYVDDIYERLRTQNANVWVYKVQGALYPFARPIGERLGVIAGYEGVLSGSVRDTDFGQSFDVEFSEVFAGIRARHPFGNHQLGFDLTFGSMSAGLVDEGGRANAPDLRYTLIRSALDVTVDLGLVQVSSAIGFRLPLGYGQIADVEWFPRIGGYGVEAAAGLDYPLSKVVSLGVGASLRRYVLEMNSEPRDAMEGISEVAGGAIDLYLSGTFGVTFRL